MKSLLYIGNALSMHGSNPTAIESLGPTLESKGFLVKYSSSKKNKILRFLDMIFTTIQNVDKVDYVLIDTYSTLNFWYAFAVSQICRLAKLKYIPILHGGHLPSRIKKYPGISSMIFKNAYINVAPSEYMLHEMKSCGYENVKVIPNQIDLSLYKFTQRSNFKPKFLWVRSLASIYNPKMAIESLFEIQKLYPNAELCIVGPDKGQLQEMKHLAKSLNVSVSFKGQLSKVEWTTLSEKYDIFLNTSKVDNMPVSVIEAMALGLAVISTNVGGIPFLISDGKSGLLVPGNDAKQMTQKAIAVIVNDEMSKDLTKNARQTVEGFDAEVVYNRWFKILK